MRPPIRLSKKGLSNSPKGLPMSTSKLLISRLADSFLKASFFFHISSSSKLGFPNLFPNLRSPKYLSVHRFHYTGGMPFTQMGISLHHLQGFVSQYFSNFGQTCSVHGKIGGSAVAQIVKTEVIDSR